MTDVSQITAEEMVAAMITVRDSAVPAGLLRAGDRIVYHHMYDAYNVATVESVKPSDSFWSGVEITTDLGHTWSCSSKNQLCHRVAS